MSHDDDLEKALDRACGRRDDGKRTLACARAFELADRYDVPVGKIGELCNERDIRIVHCQLGCFA